MTRRITTLLIGSLLLAACGQHSEGAAPKASGAPAPCAPIAQATPSAKTTSTPTPTPTPRTGEGVPTSGSTLTSTTGSREHDVDVDAKLVLKRLVVAHGVDKREPVSPAASFSRTESKRIYAFVEVENPDKKDTEIVVSFAKAGAADGAGVHLRVGASRRWRTWAISQTPKSAGSWRVVVRDAAGKKLGESTFAITDDAKPESKPEPKPEAKPEAEPKPQA